MLKKTIKYTNFDGVDEEVVAYFNLSKPELVELTIDGSFEQQLKKIVEARDVKAIVLEVKKLIHLSYGIKSEDGKRFIKTPEIIAEFAQTAAYDELYMELAMDADKLAKFIKGIAPAGLIDATAGQVHVQDKPVGPPPRPASALPPPPPANPADL